jgi:hypothetical protein
MELHLGNKAATYDKGIRLSDIMAWCHFGTETMPPIPVLRISAENIKAENKDRIKAYFQNILFAKTDSDRERLDTVLLTSLGQQMAAEARRIIDAGEQLQHNAPATVRAKGFDQPLYVDGTMAKNISYEVVK